MFGQGSAYFLLAMGIKPERCEVNQPLTWKGDGKVVRVTKMPVSPIGTPGFNLLTFQSATDAKPEYWYVENSV